MSARQAFIPRPPSCAPSSETNGPSRPMDTRDRDGDVSGNGKARSIAAFLGHKRGAGTDAESQGARPTQGQGLSANVHRRSFEGLLRPEMTPMSIIPYPAMKQHIGTEEQQQVAGQTPRKMMGPGPFEFPRPLTPASMPRVLKKGLRGRSDGRDEDTLNGNTNSIAFMGPGGDRDMGASGGADMGGYMRVFQASASGRNASEDQLANLEHDISAPVPRCVLGAPDTNMGDVGRDAESVFVRSRSLDAMSEAEVGMEQGNDPQRNFRGTKRGTRAEDAEESRWYTDGDNRAQLAKRMRHAQHDPDEYLPISSPHISPTPAPQTSFVGALDPTMIAGAIFENIEEYVNFEEIEADWKRYRECSREEWLKDADKLAQEYTEMLNMVKDHLTEKVMAYTSMISSVEERRAEVNRNSEIIHKKGETVRENISQLGKK